MGDRSDDERRRRGVALLLAANSSGAGWTLVSSTSSRALCLPVVRRGAVWSTSRSGERADPARGGGVGHGQHQCGGRGEVDEFQDCGPGKGECRRRPERAVGEPDATARMVSTADIVAARAAQKVVMASPRPTSAAATSFPTLLTTGGRLSMLRCNPSDWPVPGAQRRTFPACAGQPGCRRVGCHDRRLVHPLPLPVRRLRAAVHRRRRICLDVPHCPGAAPTPAPSRPSVAGAPWSHSWCELRSHGALDGGR
jgi:hypothetical protein